MRTSTAARLSFFILLFILAACSNTKNTFVNRTFHNLSAHYNGYYNAGLKLEDGEEKLAASHQDKYDRVLSVFKYGDQNKAKAIFPQMDDAIKRTSTVISRHTIINKNGNEVPSAEKWIDDNWLVYGKALFFKHEYFEAIETFKYIESTYKKEPTRFAASLWLAKCFLELTQLREAEDKLDYLRNQKDMPRKLKGEYEAVAADFYLQTKNVQKGIEHLKKASILARKRVDRIRYMFILAQLYQKQNDYQKAFSLYTQVIKKNPPYEMDFNARINRARCYDADSKGGESVKKELLKMKKDPKNKEYFDQIYYALAGIAQKENNEAEAIDYLNQSVKASTSNNNQKALSYLELGKIYFAKPEYKKSQAYYDSTVSYLGNDYPTYSEILNRRNTLTKLVKYLRTIQLEDSLQQLAKLSKEDQEKLISDKIRKEEEEKEKEKEEQQSNQIFQQNTQEANQFNKGAGSNWYFYNAQAVSFGMNEFAKKWGNRKLEDNWRRSSKETVLQNEEPEQKDSLVSNEKEIKSAKELQEEKKKNMLKSIPASTEALNKSTNKIIDAFYNAAMIYKDQLNDPREAAILFEELLEKYPKCKYELQSYYQLYRIYAALSEKSKADHYKNIILTEHGDSEYAEILRNPNYAAEMAGRKSNLEIYYEETYRKFLNAEYASVIQRKGESDLLYPQNPLVPKFDYLKTLSIGKTQSLKTFEVSLQDIIRNYSGDPVKDQAQDILDYIHGKSSEMQGEQPPAADTTKRLYVYNPDTTQFVIIAFQNIGGPVNSDTLRRKLSNYNGKYYSLKGYGISNLLYDHRTQIVVVKEFANKEEALEYHNGLNDNDEVYGNLDPVAYQQFIISSNNFAAFIGEKKLDVYYDFFRSFYK
ncbi:MAG: tetratricopeptide repeat protein [Bacteroidetes bacterium]|nr:tetratricopeptide repeat protein [Bacteroidota bacterium]